MLSIQEQTQILYEIAMDIGGSTDIQVMLKRSVQTILRKLNGLGCVVFADRKRNETPFLEEIFMMPRNLRRNPIYRKIADTVIPHDPPGRGRTDWGEPECLPIDNVFEYVFDLEGYGALVLLVGTPVETTFIQSLKPLLQKLAETCIACENTTALEKNRKNLQITLDSIGDAVIATDASGNITWMNPVAEKLTGWTEKESRSKPLETVFHIINTITREKVENPVHQVLEKGEKIGLANHTTLIAKNGLEFQVADSASPIKNEKGVILGVVLVFRDVTDDYAIRMALQKSEKRFRTTIESTPLGIHFYQLTHDDQLIFTGANPVADTILGIDNSIFVGKTIEEAFPPLAATEIPDQYRKVAKTGESWRTEQVEYDEGVIRGAYDVIAYQTEQNKMVAMFADITERKRSEIKLQESEENLKITLDSIGDAVVATDIRGNIIRMNLVAEELTGWSLEQGVRSAN